MKNIYSDSSNRHAYGKKFGVETANGKGTGKGNMGKSSNDAVLEKRLQKLIVITNSDEDKLSYDLLKKTFKGTNVTVHQCEDGFMYLGVTLTKDNWHMVNYEEMDEAVREKTECENLLEFTLKESAIMSLCFHKLGLCVHDEFESEYESLPDVIKADPRGFEVAVQNVMNKTLGDEGKRIMALDFLTEGNLYLLSIADKDIGSRYMSSCWFGKEQLYDLDECSEFSELFLETACHDIQMLKRYLGWTELSYRFEI